MISIQSLLYKIDQRLDKLASNAHQQIPVEDKILSLNENQNKLVKLKVDGNSIYKLGLDGFKKRYQDLQFLIENPEDHPLTPELSDVYLNKYIAATNALSPSFMFYIDSYMIADKGECTDRVVYTNADLVKHADITILLNNSNYKPSFEYQETIVDISSDELHYYTDGSFTPKKVYVTYIRYPKKMDAEGYVHFDGTESTNVDCELEEYLEDELLDLVMLDLSLFTENQEATQAARLKLTNNE